MRFRMFLAVLTLVAVAQFAGAAGPTPATTPDAVVSFTFDDGARNIFTNAFPLLAHEGFAATLYLKTDTISAGDPWSVDWDQVDILVGYGWEIGAHTHTHPHLPGLPSAKLADELDRPFKIMAEHGIEPLAFASPYGDFNDSVITEVRKRYSSHRRAWGGTEGMNPMTEVNAYNISALEIDKDLGAEDVIKYVDRAVKEHKWLVLLVHQVAADRPEDYEIKAEKLRAVVKHVAEYGDRIAVRTVSGQLATIR